MSKSSTTAASKNSTPLSLKSAWAKGPPQAATAHSSPFESPAQSKPVYQTHSRRPSVLGQGISIKDGVSIPRSNIGSAVAFGSINEISTAISSSPAPAPAIKSAEGVKSFETIPAASRASLRNGVAGHVNSMASTSPSSRSPIYSPPLQPQMHQHMPMVYGGYPYPNPEQQYYQMYPTLYPPPMPIKASHGQPPHPGPHIDVKKIFQNPISASSTNKSSEIVSPSFGNSRLPLQHPSSHPPPQSHSPTSQSTHSFTPIVPNGSVRPPQNNGPNGSAGLSSSRLVPHSQSFPLPTSTSASISRLNANSNASVPRTRITLKKRDSTQVNLENSSAVKNIPTPPQQGSVYRQDGSLSMPNTRSPRRVGRPGKDQRKQRQVEEAKAIDYQDGADPEEPPSPAASAARGEIPDESADEQSDIAAIKCHVRSLVKRMQSREVDTPELTANYFNFSVTDDEDKNIIAIINLLVAKEEAN